MEKLRDIQQAETKVLTDTREVLRELRRLSEDVDSPSQGIDRLRDIRTTLYENLNQIQHEYLILQGLRWLRAGGYNGEYLEWYWNPRQTGNSSEPDLLAREGSRVVLSAEATTSESPQGVIDSRMRHTLAKLSSMEGDKFYFVRTIAMATRARTKVSRNSWNIEVVHIEQGRPNPSLQRTPASPLKGTRREAAG